MTSATCYDETARKGPVSRPKIRRFFYKKNIFTQFPCNFLALLGRSSTEAPSDQERSENESSGLLNADDHQKNDDI